MALYKIKNNQITKIERTTFAHQKLRERDDLQEMLKLQIEIISPNTLIVAEEFGDWEESRRRIDLLGIDKSANLVVIELKRTEDGGHMELQAIRYAAMISTLTFKELVDIFATYLEKNNIDENAEESLLEFLEWSEPNEDAFAQEVRIVLAGADFSKELTSSVMWLNEFKLDIRCVRLHPYIDDGETYLDVQTVIPLPEVSDYQIRVREKRQKEREARSDNRDFTKYDLSIAGHEFKNLTKRGLFFHLISQLVASGKHPQELSNYFKNNKFKVLEGELSSEEVVTAIMQEDIGGTVAKANRYFTDDGEFFCVDGKTFVLSNQWAKKSIPSIDKFKEAYPEMDISLQAVET